ncbi:MAG: (2Fe-2S)-binding protein [Pseudomonadota bacterium]
MEKHLLELSVNDEVYEIAVKPNDTLLEVLREKLGLVGTKEACGLGECGACTVLINGRPVLSCLTLALDAAGTHITTIEGVSPGEGLDPVQEAFITHGAVQCGFCTPGMILTAKELLQRVERPTEEQIREAISGNLCRCTGYVKIVEAIQAVKGGEGL